MKTKVIHTEIDAELHKLFKAEVARRGVKMSEGLEIAIKMFLGVNDEKPNDAA